MKVYLITSDSHVLLKEKINEIIKNDTNVVRYNFNDSNIDDILEEASYVSMFNEMKYEIVLNADFFGKTKLNDKDNKKLLNYLENPYPYTTLIFTTLGDVDKRKNITKKIIESNSFLNLEAPKGFNLFQDIKSKMSIYKINDNLIKYINEACLNNYDLIISEINKFKLIKKRGEVITDSEVKDNISSNASENVFKFADSVVQKNYKEAMKFIIDYKSVKGDTLNLINILIREYRLIIYYKLLEKKRYSSREMLSKLKLLDWQLNKIKAEASLYHIDDVKDIFLNLSNIDIGIKSGKMDKDMALYNFITFLMEY